MRDIRITPEERELIIAYRKHDQNTQRSIRKLLDIKEPERQQDAGRILVFER